MLFQLLFYSVMGNYFFLGSMDHLLSKPGIVSATNKDSIKITRCVALYDVVRFNSGSYLLSFYMLCLAYVSVLKDSNWHYDSMPPDLLYSLLFAAPAAFMSVMAFIVPLILNPFVVSADARETIWTLCLSIMARFLIRGVWLTLFVFVSIFFFFYSLDGPSILHFAVARRSSLQMRTRVSFNCTKEVLLVGMLST
jgi:hypothetical protein